MIKLQQITDIVLIKEYLLKDKLYKNIFPKDSIDWMLTSKTIRWYEVKKKDKTIGIFLTYPIAEDKHIFHGGIFKKYRGRDSIEILKECLNQLPSNYKTTFVTTTTINNIPAIKLLEKAGFSKLTQINNTFIFVE
jgi:RimJ/RimL family protein N-acetyltransferase